MQWPLSQDYNEAVQVPSASFADPELAGGEPIANALGLPVPRSGNFADVYEFVGASGAHLAVKCFTREIPGLHERYSEVSKHLMQAALPFSVNFTYLERGIQIQNTWYPILKMDWVDGFLLNEFVRNNLGKPELLDGLAQIWVRTAKGLHDAEIAHGDLQHGNVILVPSRAGHVAVRLIDYDGMLVPALADKKSGEVGHPAYQHPRRLREGTYGREVDRFPQLAIYTALRALAVGGKSLWETYDTGDNLLFRQQDFDAPGKSALFAQLLRITEVRPFAVALIDAARVGLEYTPFLQHLVPDALQSSQRITRKAPASAANASSPTAQGRERPDWLPDVANAVTAQAPRAELPAKSEDSRLDPRSPIVSSPPLQRKGLPFTAIAVLLCLCCLVLGVLGGVYLTPGTPVLIMAGISCVCCLVLGVLGGRALASCQKRLGTLKAVVRNGGIDVDQPINLPNGTELSIPIPTPAPEVPGQSKSYKAPTMAGSTAMFCLCCFSVGLFTEQMLNRSGERPSVGIAGVPEGINAVAVPSHLLKAGEVQGGLLDKELPADQKSNANGKKKKEIEIAAPSVPESSTIARLGPAKGSAQTKEPLGEGKAEKKPHSSIISGAEENDDTNKKDLRPRKRGPARIPTPPVQKILVEEKKPPPAKETANKLAEASRSNPKDPQLNEILRSLVKDAGKDPGFLIKVIGNPDYPSEARVEAAVSLVSIGPVPEAKRIVPDLLKVLGDPDDHPKVRWRVMWSLRVHGQDLAQMPEVLSTLEKVFLEKRQPKQDESKMLHYDCAYLLGQLKGANVQEKTLDVLLEFLRDKTIQIYVGRKQDKEVGRNDARGMAIDALTSIGSKRLATRKDIIEQLSAIEADNQAWSQLREKARTLVRKVQAELSPPAVGAQPKPKQQPARVASPGGSTLVLGHDGMMIDLFAAHQRTHLGHIQTAIMMDRKTIVPGQFPAKMLRQSKPLPAKAGEKQSLGFVSVCDVNNVQITQIVEVVPAKATTEASKRLLHTMMVRYVVDNKDSQAHEVGLRVWMDVFLVKNDGALFAAPNKPGQILDGVELKGKDVPDYLRVLEVPNLEKPGLVAYFSYNLGRSFERPNRVALTSLAGVNPTGWDMRVLPAMGDSAMGFCWDARQIQPGGSRNLAYAYGQGICHTLDGAQRKDFTEN